MNGKMSRFSWVLLIFLNLSPTTVAAQLASNSTQLSATPAGPNGAPQTTAQNLQTVSQTGLLPLFAVDMQFDPSWVDSNDVPSKSANYSHSGVNDTFQQAWEALKPGGFNAIRFDVNLQDPQAPVRLANLCMWAKANNVLLIPVLKSSGTGTKTTTVLIRTHAPVAHHRGMKRGSMLISRLVSISLQLFS